VLLRRLAGLETTTNYIYSLSTSSNHDAALINQTVCIFWQIWPSMATTFKQC